MKISSLVKMLIAALFVAFLVSSIGYFGSMNAHADSCEKLKGIAKNQEKISYLKKWIGKKISEEDFLLHMGRLGLSNALDAPSHFDKLKLDTDFLGINKLYAFVLLNRSVEQSARYMEKSTIESVSIGEGRNSIVIILNDSGNSGIEGIDNIQDKLQTIHKDVMVICR